MKNILIAVVVLIFPATIFAQRHSFYVDAGLSLARLYPGTSTTYNVNVARFIGLGAGFQGYDYHATIPNFQLIPTAYGEVRFTIRPHKKNQFFFTFDKGINFYKKTNERWRQNNLYCQVKDDNGSYTGIGFGYLRKGKGAWAHYWSLKLIANSYNVTTYNYITRENGEGRLGRATFVASFGFRVSQ
jgi:hypothetical protein